MTSTAVVKPTEDNIAALIAELDRISHPAANLFPLLIHSDPDGWSKFLTDLDDRGQLHPIIFDAKGILLAGRNRWLACKLLGLALKVETRDLSGAAATAFVLSDNLIRRHDEIGPRAIYTAKLFEMMKADSENFRTVPTQLQMAASANMSDTHFRAAQKLIRDQPEIAEEVAKGKLVIAAGRALAKEPKEKRDKTLASIRASKDKKEAKKIVKEGKPPKLRMVDPENPKRELTGTYSTILAAMKAVAALPNALRHLDKFIDSHPISVTQAWDIKREILRLLKVDFKDIPAAAEVGLRHVDDIIDGAPDPRTISAVADARETEPETV